MTLRTRLFVLLLSTPLVAFVIVGGLLGRASAGQGAYQHLQLFDDVMSLIMNNYVEDVNVDKVMDGAMRGLAEGLDSDSAYLTAAEVKQLENRKDAPPGDTGIELTRQYYLRVVAAREGSPADKAGLRTGDYIRAIDGKPTRNMSAFEGATALRGQPGTKVVVTVLRGNAVEPHEVTLTRERPAGGPAVTGRVQTPGVGYIKVKTLAGTAVADLATQVKQLTTHGADKLILDLRGTAEGALENGFEAARLFIPSGTLGIREARGQENAPVGAKSGDGKTTATVAVLVTNGTSGAAELLAAALKENNRADLVGERTFGRAGVQHLVKLPDGSGLWMTHARYLSPTGKPIHGAGVTPTLEVEEPEIEFGAAPPSDDPILDKAVATLSVKRAA